MKTKLILLMITCFIALVSCKENKSPLKAVSMDAEFSPSFMMAPPPPGASLSVNQEQYNPRLVKKGELTISSNDIESTKTLIYGFVKKCKGHVTKESLEKNEVFSSVSISLTVEATHFDLFLQLLDSAKLNITSRSFTVEDVTMKYIDDSTRLQNKKKLEKKYLDLLSRTKEVTDLIAIEEKLEQIQTDIEVRESQLKTLNKIIAYSEFSIRIEKYASNLTLNERNKFTYRLGQGIVRGWEGIKLGLVFLLSIWPLYILIAITILLIKAFIRRRRNRK